MARLRYLASASQNLIHIFSYVSHESGSSATGRRLVKRLREVCVRLAGFPGEIGHRRDELLSGLRSFPAGSYIIYFRYGPDGILEIVSILERHRDAGAYFEGETR